jgi:RNA polymerase sigma-B factor
MEWKNRTDWSAAPVVAGRPMKEVEIELWRRYRQREPGARDALILYYAPLVAYWVKQIARKAPWANTDDLVQDGTIGLMRAVEKFELERGLEFSTFARYDICGYIRESPELTRNLAGRQEKRNRTITKAHDRLALTLGRKPTRAEIANELELSVSQVEDAISAKAIAFAAGISEPDYDVPLWRLPRGSKSARFVDQETKVVILDALSHVNKKEASILIGSLWHGESDAEIGERMGMTEGGISRARRRAVNNLRKLLGVETGSTRHERR